MSSLSSQCSVNDPHLCDCGLVAVVKSSGTVKNFRRRFYTCPLWDPVTKEGGCNYFEWTDLQVCPHKRIAAKAKKMMKEVEEKLEKYQQREKIYIFVIVILVGMLLILVGK